jgi:hypothetical protein
MIESSGEERDWGRGKGWEKKGDHFDHFLLLLLL